MQGEPVLPDVVSVPFYPLVDFSLLPIRKQKELAGNSVHLEVLGVFTFYVLTNVEIEH